MCACSTAFSSVSSSRNAPLSTSNVSSLPNGSSTVPKTCAGVAGDRTAAATSPYTTWRWKAAEPSVRRSGPGPILLCHLPVDEQVVRDALGQGGDRERRVGAERAGYDRAVGDVEALVHLTGRPA